jgi:hypothetical protein
MQLYFFILVMGFLYNGVSAMQERNADEPVLIGLPEKECCRGWHQHAQQLFALVEQLDSKIKQQNADHEKVAGQQYALIEALKLNAYLNELLLAEREEMHSLELRALGKKYRKALAQEMKGHDTLVAQLEQKIERLSKENGGLHTELAVTNKWYTLACAGFYRELIAKQKAEEACKRAKRGLRNKKRSIARLEKNNADYRAENQAYYTSNISLRRENSELQSENELQKREICRLQFLLLQMYRESDRTNPLLKYIAAGLLCPVSFSTSIDNNMESLNKELRRKGPQSLIGTLQVKPPEASNVINELICQLDYSSNVAQGKSLPS